MTYSLWDLESGNLVGAFPTETAALVEVRDTVRRFGREEALKRALASVNDAGQYHAIAEGQVLIDRAFGVVTA